ncbi:MAG TPA: hypothetical protein VEQ66_09925 [Propionibacteriaceae bacterium]|nr:hypothetical protein [Propionibacteriaceae bacterium]
MIPSAETVAIAPTTSTARTDLRADPGGGVRDDLAPLPSVDPEPGPRTPTLLDEFVACRTTLDDLQQRIAARGEQLTITDIAHHLTGRMQLSPALHRLLVDAINERHTELAAPATAQYRRD